MADQSTGSVLPLESPGAQDSDHNSANQIVQLPSGTPLVPADAARITRDFLTRVVALIGPVRGGKTTLLASPYECFQAGPFAGYSFAGSATMVGFERICHLGRLGSNLPRADMERTPLGPHACFHLRVWSQSTGHRNLLLSNISGEECNLAVDSNDECRRLDVLRRADHVVLVLDCGDLSNLERRQDSRNYATTLLRSLKECELIDRRSILGVAFNKWDLVEASPQKNEALLFLDTVEADIRTRFQGHIGALRFYRTAARPESGPLAPGYGVDKLFGSWLDESRLTEPGVRIHFVAPLVSTEFDRYERRFPSIEDQR